MGSAVTENRYNIDKLDGPLDFAIKVLPHFFQLADFQMSDSEHQDVMQEVSVVKKEIQFHDMSFGAEFLNIEG